jgi:hypothetical protein
MKKPKLIHNQLAIYAFGEGKPLFLMPNSSTTSSTTKPENSSKSDIPGRRVS